MNIVLITPSLTVGGSQRYISEIANYWSVENDVTLINLRNTGVFYCLNSTIKVHNLSHQWDGIISKASSGVSTGKEIRNIVKNTKPDFVLSTFSPTNILTLISLSGLKYKIFIRDSFGSNYNRNGLEMRLRKFFYPKATGIIAQTEDIKTQLSKELNLNNIATIANPVRKIPSINNDEKKKFILTVGELVARKGHHLFLDAIKLLHLKNWKVLIVGKGLLKTELENRILLEKLSDKIEIIPPKQEIDYFYQQASIFVLPSLIEGLPNALLEAMSAGLPCVSFDCDTGPREIIDDNENGYLVPVKNIEVFAAKINMLMSDSVLRNDIGQKAKKKMENYSIEKIAYQLDSFMKLN